MKFRYVIPFVLTVGMIILLGIGLGLNPRLIPSPLINHPTPKFSLPTLFGNNPLTQQDFQEHVTIFNVWATWCESCADEHVYLLQLSADKNLQFIGLDYKDDSTVAKNWLTKQGNPYKKIGVDADGSAAIDWGVYGTPETFIIDKHGLIRGKHIGPLDPSAWQSLLPLIKKLEAEK